MNGGEITDNTTNNGRTVADILVDALAAIQTKLAKEQLDKENFILKYIDNHL